MGRDDGGERMRELTGWRARLLCVAVLAVLAAVMCFASTAAAEPTTTTDTSVGAAAAADAPQAIDEVVIKQLALINHFRVTHHRARLRLDAQLMTSSAWMANDMATKNYFAHRDSDRRGWYRRLRDFHYPMSTTWTGENIAAGHEDATATFQQWLHSPHHRRNMLNSHYRAIGLARVFVAGSTYGWYWVTDFGSQVDSPLYVQAHAAA